MKNDDHFDDFRDHTLLKHAILEAYLEAWAFKLIQWGGGGRHLYVVDGFAGAGKDAAGNPGSPLVACRIAAKVRGAMSAKTPPIDGRVTVIAVESHKKRFAALQKALGSFLEDPEVASAYCSEMHERTEEFARRAGDAPTLYFLDPFGVKGLRASGYPTMLHGPSNEIFALFADIGAVRLRGVVHGTDQNEQRIRDVLQAPSIFEEWDQAEIAELKAESAAKAAWRERFAPGAEAAITDALGDDSWIAALAGMTPDEARQELLLRFGLKLRQAGAAHLLYIPIRDAKGVHKHFLIYATKSRMGLRAMKDAVSEGLNRKDLAPVMRDRIRDDLRVPLHAVLDQLSAKFAGQTVRWTDKKGKDAGTVRGYLLAETDVFTFQCPDIHDALKSASVLSRRKVDICDFRGQSTDP